MATAPDLLRAFDRLGGRARLALVSRALEGRSKEAFAGELGIPVASGEVMLFRAVAELEAALAARSPGDVPPRAEALPDAEERAAATALSRALDEGLGREETAGGPLLARRVALARTVRATPELREALVLPAPPQPTLRERARRLAWLAVVVAAAILYSRWSAR